VSLLAGLVYTTKCNPQVRVQFMAGFLEPLFASLDIKPLLFA
jgi:hypothetical protein